MHGKRHWFILFRDLVGIIGRSRLPRTHGRLTVPNLDAPVVIRRDRWGVPHITAQTDHDAWLALGFCQAQDRPFQLEFLRRLIRGELTAVIGPSGLPYDRLVWPAESASDEAPCASYRSPMVKSETR